MTSHWLLRNKPIARVVRSVCSEIITSGAIPHVPAYDNLKSALKIHLPGIFGAESMALHTPTGNLFTGIRGGLIAELKYNGCDVKSAKRGMKDERSI
ncbi:hypothetical protein L596_005590 [Steinernema carpocapsae]|uniref:Uncharacterized protein n=1 Tax=Steinernema carpocapsae TaxID=34508 RepID=A0A4U8UZR3_STECR|nr:hypothetical protein L596_005590 [Steinernema carpocapsae]